MKLSEVVGTIVSILFAAIVLPAFAVNTPLYTYWGDNLRRLAPLNIGQLGESISRYVWVDLFPALVGFIFVLLALVFGLTALLWSEEKK